MPQKWGNFQLHQIQFWLHGTPPETPLGKLTAFSPDGDKGRIKLKVKAYIASQTAKCCCSGALHHRQSGRAAYRPWAKPRGTATKQPHAALVCRLMVFTLILHLITWFTTHFLTPKGWKAELAWSGKVLQPKTDVVTTEPRRV